jgi:hypothetical protein
MEYFIQYHLTQSVVHHIINMISSITQRRAQHYQFLSSGTIKRYQLTWIQLHEQVVLPSQLHAQSQPYYKVQ